MRKYVSLGTAMMVGAVIGREKKSPVLQRNQRVSTEFEAAETLKAAHLDKPALIPKHEIEDFENRFYASERSNSPNVQYSSDSIDTSRSHEVQASSLERPPPRRQIKRRKSPKAPNVRQHWQCTNTINLPYDRQFNCFDPSDGIWKTCWSLNVNNNGNYKCFDHTNGKWEWPNWNEVDFTPDNSNLTSIHTDGILTTSPSINVEAEDSVTPSIDDYRTSVNSSREFPRDEFVEAEPCFNRDGDVDGMTLSDRSVDRAKAAYYRPGRRYGGSP
jgi:hypothetical protein